MKQLNVSILDDLHLALDTLPGKMDAVRAAIQCLVPTPTYAWVYSLDDFEKRVWVEAEIVLFPSSPPRWFGSVYVPQDKAKTVIKSMEIPVKFGIVFHDFGEGMAAGVRFGGRSTSFSTEHDSVIKIDFVGVTGLSKSPRSEIAPGDMGIRYLVVPLTHEIDLSGRKTVHKNQHPRPVSGILETNDAGLSQLIDRYRRHADYPRAAIDFGTQSVKWLGADSPYNAAEELEFAHAWLYAYAEWKKLPHELRTTLSDNWSCERKTN